MNGKICYRERPKTFFVYFCCKVGHFHMRNYGVWLASGASLKWPLEEQQLLALLHWLHFSAPEVAAWDRLNMEEKKSNETGEFPGCVYPLHDIWKYKPKNKDPSIRATWWQETKADMRRTEGFHNGYLRSLCGIFWPNTITLEQKKTKTLTSSLT